MNAINHLSISWAISRGRDTYGWNICRLDDRNNGRRYRCHGGGYDMIGTVFGDWLQSCHQEDLKALFAHNTSVDCGYQVPGYRKIENLYGLTLSPNGVASCDGACGIESMINIANAIGLSVEREVKRKSGQTIGFYVQKGE